MARRIFQRTVLIEFAPGHYADPGGFLRAIDTAGFRIALIDRARGPIAVGLEALGAIQPPAIENLLLTR